jgi:hypothetical protein
MAQQPLNKNEPKAKRYTLLDFTPLCSFASLLEEV